MLGADGRRTYLFLFQNNAEARSTGGIPGSFATITADHGRLSFGRQSDAGSLGKQSSPALPLTSQEEALFGRNLGVYPQDVNTTPDFPRSAELISAMWRQDLGERVDGVVSVDPVALSYMMRGTGPVKIAGGTQLDASNAVRILLSQVYADIAVPSAQNEFFNVVADDVFAAATRHAQNPAELLRGITQSATEQRLLIWSRHRDEQAILAPTSISGTLATTASRSPDVGVFLNAAIGYKLDYYLHARTKVVSTSCRADEQHLKVTLRMRSSVPSNFRKLSTYVAPRNVPLFGAGSIVDTAFVVAPIGGSIDRLELDGDRLDVSTKRLGDRRVLTQTVALKPGTSKTVTVWMTAGQGQRGQVHLRTTPGAQSSGVGSVGTSACS
jgi:hypothetical protein